MFQFECLQLNGKPISYCFNSYLVGTCCLLPEKLRLPILEQQKLQQNSSSEQSSSDANQTAESQPGTRNNFVVMSHFVPNNNGQMDLDNDEKKTLAAMGISLPVTLKPQEMTHSTTVSTNIANSTAVPSSGVLYYSPAIPLTKPETVSPPAAESVSSESSRPDANPTTPSISNQTTGSQFQPGTSNNLAVTSDFVPNNNGQMNINDDEKMAVTTADIQVPVTFEPQKSTFSTIVSNIVNINFPIAPPPDVFYYSSSAPLTTQETVSPSTAESVSFESSLPDNEFSPSPSTGKPFEEPENLTTVKPVEHVQISQTTTIQTVQPEVTTQLSTFDITSLNPSSAEPTTLAPESVKNEENPVTTTQSSIASPVVSVSSDASQMATISNVSDENLTTTQNELPEVQTTTTSTKTAAPVSVTTLEYDLAIITVKPESATSDNANSPVLLPTVAPVTTVKETPALQNTTTTPLLVTTLKPEVASFSAVNFPASSIASSEASITTETSLPETITNAYNPLLQEMVTTVNEVITEANELSKITTTAPIVESSPELVANTLVSLYSEKPQSTSLPQIETTTQVSSPLPEKPVLTTTSTTVAPLLSVSSEVPSQAPVETTTTISTTTTTASATSTPPLSVLSEVPSQAPVETKTTTTATTAVPTTASLITYSPRPTSTTIASLLSVSSEVPSQALLETTTTISTTTTAPLTTELPTTYRSRPSPVPISETSVFTTAKPIIVVPIVTTLLENDSKTEATTTTIYAPTMKTTIVSSPLPAKPVQTTTSTTSASLLSVSSEVPNQSPLETTTTISTTTTTASATSAPPLSVSSKVPSQAPVETKTTTTATTAVPTTASLTTYSPRQSSVSSPTVAPETTIPETKAPQTFAPTTTVSLPVATLKLEVESSSVVSSFASSNSIASSETSIVTTEASPSEATTNTGDPLLQELATIISELNELSKMTTIASVIESSPELVAKTSDAQQTSTVASATTIKETPAPQTTTTAPLPVMALKHEVASSSVPSTSSEASIATNLAETTTNIGDPLLQELVTIISELNELNKMTTVAPAIDSSPETVANTSQYAPFSEKPWQMSTPLSIIETTTLASSLLPAKPMLTITPTTTIAPLSPVSSEVPSQAPTIKTTTVTTTTTSAAPTTVKETPAPQNTTTAPLLVTTLKLEVASSSAVSSPASTNSIASSEANIATTETSLPEMITNAYNPLLQEMVTTVNEVITEANELSKITTTAPVVESSPELVANTLVSLYSEKPRSTSLPQIEATTQVSSPLPEKPVLTTTSTTVASLLSASSEVPSQAPVETTTTVSTTTTAAPTTVSSTTYRPRPSSVPISEAPVITTAKPLLVPMVTTLLGIANKTATISTTTSAPSSPALPPLVTLLPIPSNSSLIDNGTLLRPSTEPSPITRLTTMWTTTLKPTTKRPLSVSDVFKPICGLRQMAPKSGRVIGGKQSGYGDWPWMVSLRQWKKNAFVHKCGATLLNEYWVVTAAHCVENVKPTNLLVRLGEYDISTDKEPYAHIERRIQIIAPHPQFDPRTFEYDLALLRLFEPVRFQRNIFPICLPDFNETFVGRWATVTGWGRLREEGPLPNVIHHAEVPIINNQKCEEMYQEAGYIEHIPNIFVCAGFAKGTKDSCEGDSGGPLVIEESGRWSLVGIISWGIGCALPNQPGVYTRITAFTKWINQIIAF